MTSVSSVDSIGCTAFRSATTNNVRCMRKSAYDATLLIQGRSDLGPPNTVVGRVLVIEDAEHFAAEVSAHLALLSALAGRQQVQLHSLTSAEAFNSSVER